MGETLPDRAGQLLHAALFAGGDEDFLFPLQRLEHSAKLRALPPPECVGHPLQRLRDVPAESPGCNCGRGTSAEQRVALSLADRNFD